MVTIVGLLTFLSLLFLKPNNNLNLMERYTDLMLFRKYGQKYNKAPIFINPIAKRAGDFPTYYFKTKDLLQKDEKWETNLKRSWLRKEN